MSRKKLYNAGPIVYSTDPDVVRQELEDKAESLPPQDQPLRLRIDTKHRAGKTVTLVEGFRGNAEDLERLCKNLKSYCASGGTWEQGQIIIQGNHIEKIFQWLNKNGYKKAKKL